MKKRFTFLLLCLLALGASAQLPTLDWAQSYNSTQGANAVDITTDLQGNVYVTGTFFGQMDFDPGPGIFNMDSGAGEDAFLQKLDSNGALVWAKQIECSVAGRGDAIEFDSMGNIFLTGPFDGSCDFDPGPGTNIVTSNGFADIYVLKLDSNGNFVWVVTSGSSIRDVGIDIAVDESGNVYSFGYFRDSMDLDPGPGTQIAYSAVPFTTDLVLRKFDPNGNLIWARTMGGPMENLAQSISLDPSGNVLATSVFEGTTDFDPGPGVANFTAAGSWDSMIHKFDSAGNYLWARQIGGTNSDFAYDIACDSLGNVYTVGTFADVVDFDPGPGTFALTGALLGNGFIQKLDSNGVLIWVGQIGGNSAARVLDMDLDPLGNIYITGFFVFSGDLDPTPNILNVTTNGLGDVFVEKLSSNGSLLWVYSFGGTDSDQGNIIAVDINGQGHVYNSGSFFGTVDFEPGPGITNLTTGPNFEYYLKKLSQCFSTGLSPDQASLPTLTGGCSVAAPTAPTATTSCGNVVSGATSTPFPITTFGTTTITWTFDDGNGNVVTQTQDAIVVDTTAPIPNLPNLPDFNSSCSANLSAPLGMDNCTGLVIATTGTTFPVTAQGTTVVTWTYDDGNGNTFTQNQNVILVDSTPPVPDSLSLPVITAICQVDSMDIPVLTATDNCSGMVLATTNAIFPITDPNTAAITWTYTDSNGNSSTQAQPINWTPLDVSTTSNGLTITANNSNATYQWLDCSNNFAPIPGETNASFTAPAMGNYAVELTEEGCVDTSACALLVSVDERELYQISLFPNPSRGEFSIELGQVSASRISVRDLTGRVLLEMDEPETNRVIVQLDVPAGVYLVKVETELGQREFKMVVQ